MLFSDLFSHIRSDLTTDIFSHFACNACHRPADAAATLLPPLQGPVLDGLGSRLRAGWVKKFLTDPPAVKPGTPMPDMLAHLDGEDVGAVKLDQLREAAEDPLEARGHLDRLLGPGPDHAVGDGDRAG